jgi:hypothetical protein
MSGKSARLIRQRHYSRDPPKCRVATHVIKRADICHGLPSGVVANRNGALPFDVNLGPGDAALYGVFLRFHHNPV